MIENKYKITYGDKELLAANSFITFGVGETRIEIWAANDRLTLIFEFIDDVAKPGHVKSAALVSPSELKISFTNYNDPGGLFPREPWEVGILNGRRLYLIYKISQMANTGMKDVIFSCYLQSPPAGGS